MNASARSSCLESRSESEDITAERVETKYLILPERVDGLAKELNLRLPAHRFTGEGANRLPGAHHYVTTVYFDTPSRAHFKLAFGDLGSSVKIRAKEYYDLHPSLAELATDPAELVRYQMWLWFELKRHEGSRTIKRRFRLSKRDIPSFFCAGRVTPDALLVPESDLEGTQWASVHDTLQYCRSLDQPLSACCLVNYRRLSWQDQAASLRVTLDLGLAYYSPRSDIWSRQQPLVRNTLGTPLRVEQHGILEVKHTGSTPDWLEAALDCGRARKAPFSKFLAAAEVVLGRA